MPGIVTSQFRVLNAKQFVEMHSEPEDSIYFFVSKVTPWVVEGLLPEDADNYPPQPTDAIEDGVNIWDEMIALKKTLPSDLSLGARRYDWTAGVVYQRYDNTDPQLKIKNWYVMTSQNQVFTCMDNSSTLSGGLYTGNTTTFEPYYDSGAPSVTVITTPDGYTWKYLYTVSPADLLKFSSPYWIPVVSTVTPANASTGIYSIHIDTFGTGYSAGDAAVTITGDGTGATAVPVVSGGQITRIDITAPGTGYTEATVTITGSNTSPASARANTLPRDGIGANPAIDLGAYYAIVSATLEYGESGVVPVKNQYRQFGLIRNPIKNDLTIGTESIYNMIYNLTVTTTDLFYQDEVVTVNGGTALVLEFDATNPADKKLVLVGSSTTVAASDTITIDTRSATVVSVEDEPDLIPGSGETLYVENVSPIFRAADQREQFLLICEF